MSLCDPRQLCLCQSEWRMCVWQDGCDLQKNVCHNKLFSLICSLMICIFLTQVEASGNWVG